MWSVEGSTLEPYWVSRKSVPTHRREKGISPSPQSGCEVWFREWGADTTSVYLACSTNDNEKSALVPAHEEGEWPRPVTQQRNFISMISASLGGRVLAWYIQNPQFNFSTHMWTHTQVRMHVHKRWAWSLAARSCDFRAPCGPRSKSGGLGMSRWTAKPFPPRTFPWHHWDTFSVVPSRITFLFSTYG